VKPRLAIVAAAFALLAGCASVAPQGGEAHPQDPWEGANRKVFAFNDAVDRAVLKPTAEVYQEWVPAPVRDAVGNFFGNLGDAWSAVNWMLQGQFHRGVEQGARFAWNSTVGVAGLFDVSAHFGLDKRSQDFGQTLGAWGVGMGPYVVLPLFGPSSIRDVAALPVNRLASSNWVISGSSSRVAAAALELISLRGSLLSAERVVDGITLDKYTFFRDAYLQRRGAKTNPEDDEGFEIVTTSPADKP
jgi:phospholipid-binding lipoprotein MlaA